MIRLMRSGPHAADETKVSRSLMPREHGAYGQLAMPSLAALASGRPTTASILLVVSSIAVFFAHEPLRVALGHRGTKAKRMDSGRARARAFVLGLVALATGASALVLSPPARIATMAVVPALVVVGILVIGNVDRTSLGEIVAGTALCGASVPVAAASGAGLFEALTVWGVWSFGFALTTLGVRVVTSKSAAERRLLPWIVVALVAAGILAFVGGFRIVSAAAPLALIALVLAVMRPEAKHLRRVGWALMITVIATAAGLVAHARA